MSEDLSQEQMVDELDQRMQRLSSREGLERNIGGYSAFVKSMRLVLPLGALVLVVLLFVGSEDNEPMIKPIEQTLKDMDEPQVNQNELLNPKFESADKKNQPYKITADRAIQGEQNKDLIMLEKPVGQMTLKDGMEVTMRSESGAYRQDTQRFFLQGGVHMQHQDGYELVSDEAHFDLEKKYAWSEKAVTGSGPDISIAAEGMRANGETGEIIFTGPAKLVLENGLDGAL